MADKGNENNNGASDTDEFVPTLDDVLGTGVGNDRDDSYQQEKKDKNEKRDTENSDDKGSKDEGKDESKKEQEGNEEEPKGTPQERINALLKSFSSDNIEEDKKDIRKKLLSEYKGEKFDEDGNIRDKEGNIVKNAGDIFNDLSEDEQEEENEAKPSLVDEWHKESGYEFVDEEGNPKVYADDKDGIREYSADLATAQLEEFKSQFFSQNKELTEVAKHLLSGGKLEEFGTTKDYSKINVKELSTDEKINYIRESFEKRKFSSERTKDAIQRIKDSNTVDKEAEYALEDLKEIQKEIDKERNTKFELSEKQKEKENEIYWDNIGNEIKKGQLNGVNIEDKDKQAFMDYLSKPVNAKGQSKADIDRSNEDLNAKLAFEFFRFKDYNFDTFINNKVKTDKAQSLRNLVKRSAGIKDDELQNTNANKGNNKPRVVSIDDMLG